MQGHYKLMIRTMIGFDNWLTQHVNTFGAARSFHHGYKLTGISTGFFVLDDFHMVHIAVSQPFEHVALFVACAELIDLANK